MVRVTRKSADAYREGVLLRSLQTLMVSFNDIPADFHTAVLKYTGTPVHCLLVSWLNSTEINIRAAKVSDPA